MKAANQILLVVFVPLVFVASAAAARADGEADKLLKEVAVATRSAKTLLADITLTQSDGGPVTTTPGTVMLKKPNLARIELGEPFNYTIASDGKNVWLVERAKNRYQKNDADPNGKGLASFLYIPVGTFFDPDFRGFINPSIKETRLAGKEKVDGETYQVVEVIGDEPYDFTLKCYIGANKLITRTALQMKLGDKTLTFGAVLTNVKVNEYLPDDSFAYAPPKEAVLYDLSDPAGKLVPVGEKAYRFTVPTPTGERLSLEELSKGKKAVLVNFWFYGCAPCREEFPKLQKLYDELKDKGLEVVAINFNDSPETILKYVKDNKFTFLIGMSQETEQGTKDPVLNEYRVIAYPTNYLLDADGKVVWRGVGFDEKEVRAALKKLGVL
ncbi:MAG: redoxin domain-containing protein [Chloracidobacterium sp.]|nr:redoxin domain-containing protein [Chloracidobacterium sp.]MDW8217995.1 redoxin domain-containing protein [Acidobacteriota bacterium]